MKKSRFIIAFSALAVFLIIAYFVSTGEVLAFDTVVREWFYSLQGGLDSVVICLTHIGDTKSIILICLVLLVLPWTRLKYGVPVSIAAIIASSLNHYLKTVFLRPRPDASLHLIQQGGWSFPSGHSITSMVVFGLLIWLVRSNVKNKKLANSLTVLLAVPWLGIGLSRIYVGVHYPTDVLGGWMLGIAILVIAVSVVEAVSRRCSAASHRL